MMNGWTDGWTDVRIEGQTNGQTYRPWIKRQTDWVSQEAALGATKFVDVRDTILVTLCCAT
jgi:hypothetical protein